MIDVILDWYEPDEDDWNEARCMYAYLDPETKKIIYIGKADDSSPRERWNGHKGDGLFEFFEDELGLEEWDTIFGEVEEIEGMSKLSFPLLLDIETLLIWHIRPRGNVQIAEPKRPGLHITCDGDWPMEKKVFVDPG